MGEITYGYSPLLIRGLVPQVTLLCLQLWASFHKISQRYVWLPKDVRYVLLETDGMIEKFLNTLIPLKPDF